MFAGIHVKFNIIWCLLKNNNVYCSLMEKVASSWCLMEYILIKVY